MELAKTLKLLSAALEQKQMSGFALGVRQRGEHFFHYAGLHGYSEHGVNEHPVTENSIFDLASITKIFSTEALLRKAEKRGLLFWESKLQDLLPDYPHSHICLRHLVEHCSGYPAHIEFFKKYAAGEAFMGDTTAVRLWIYETPFKHALGTVTEYSDLGIILTGFVLERLFQKDLSTLFAEEIAIPLGLKNSGFVVLPHARWQKASLLREKDQFVSTEVCPWRQKTLQGEVHDDNTWALGGVAGHAGLFSTVPEALKILDHVAEEAKASKSFYLPAETTRHQHNQFSQGFMLYPGLRAFSGNDFAGAFGHTGFVGTSAWHHPGKDLSVVLFTNRVHPSRSDTRWIETRLQAHSQLWQELCES